MCCVAHVHAKKSRIAKMKANSSAMRTAASKHGTIFALIVGKTHRGRPRAIMKSFHLRNALASGSHSMAKTNTQSKADRAHTLLQPDADDADAMERSSIM